MDARIFVGCGLLVLGACATPPKPVKVVPLEAEVAQLFPKPGDLGSAKVVLAVAVMNPRESAVALKTVDYVIDGGELLGQIKGRSTPEGTLGPGARGEVELEQTITFPEAKEAYRAILERGTVPIDVTGEVTFADGSKASFARKGSVAAPTLPKLIVHEAQAARYDGGKGIDLTLFLRLVNENSFTVVIDELRYAVNVNGKDIKSGKDIGVRLVSSAVSEYEESAIIDQKNFGRKAVRAVIADGVVEYQITGAIDIRGMSLPINLSGKVKLAGQQ